MPDSHSPDADFRSKITGIILENISNEQFGVSELADALNMSRSNLLRKLKKQTGLSVSQFIRQVRLERALEILRDGNATVSEISWQVGFSSTSYFIKCFREIYGYPPGEFSKQEMSSDDEEKPVVSDGKKRRMGILVAVILIVLAGILWIFLKPTAKSAATDKSIAVLPFKNESNDSTNV